MSEFLTVGEILSLDYRCTKDEALRFARVVEAKIGDKLTEANELHLAAVNGQMQLQAELDAANAKIAELHDTVRERTRQFDSACDKLAELQARFDSAEAVATVARNEDDSLTFTPLRDFYVINGMELYLHPPAQDAKDAERNRCIALIESYQVSVGNSAAGEIAYELTMGALKEIRDAIQQETDE